MHMLLQTKQHLCSLQSLYKMRLGSDVITTNLESASRILQHYQALLAIPHTFGLLDQHAATSCNPLLYSQLPSDGVLIQ